jgi:hypothetical protein
LIINGFNLQKSNFDDGAIWSGNPFEKSIKIYYKTQWYDSLNPVEKEKLISTGYNTKNENNENYALISNQLCNSVNTSSTFNIPVNVQQVEVAAGNKIDQKIHDDTETLDYWRNEPRDFDVTRPVEQ